MSSAPPAPFSDRIISRLIDAERRESCLHYRDDYRIARITVAYAARGECLLCSPQVAATYAVIGLHPDKVWPAIVERRKALWGRSLLEAIGVPKKPPGSVRFPREESLKKASGAELSIPRRRESVEPLIMATTASAYRESDELKSANLAPALPSPLVRRIDACRLRGYVVSPSGRRYLEPLRETLKSFVIVSKQGPDFHASTFGVSIQTGRSYRTIQRHIDRLCELKILKLKHEANQFVSGSIRRTATYVLHEDAGKYLAPSESFAEWKARNRRASSPRRKGPQSVAPTNHSLSPEPQSMPPRVHRSPALPQATPQPKLTKRECAKFVADMTGLMKGHTVHQEQVGGYSFELDPSDRRYRAPMPFKEAFEATCRMWRRLPDSAIDALKFWGYQLEESEPGP